MSKQAAATMDGEELVIRIKMPKAPASEPGDRLIRLDPKSCAAEGFELGGIKTKIDAGELPAVHMGRARYVRYSDLLKLPKLQPKKQYVSKEPGEVDEYEEIVAAKRRKRAG